MNSYSQHPDDLIARLKLAAQLYYVDGLPQTEVARILAVSQAKVSRLLQLARKKGIVQITVDEYQPRDEQLEKALRDEYGLGHAVVIRNPARQSLAGVRRNVAYFGAPLVAELVASGNVIGLTGGRVLADLLRHVRTPRPSRDLRCVQLMGNISADVCDYDAVELSRRVAEVYGGTYYTLNTPAFVSSAASREAFFEQQQVKTVWKLYGEMDVAMIGIGSLRDSSFIERGVLSPQDIARLTKSGAVGEICGRFFDANGQECPSDFRDRVVSIRLEELQAIPQVVGVTAGTDRAEAVEVMLRTGVIKSLVVDAPCAQTVLAIAGGKKG